MDSILEVNGEGVVVCDYCRRIAGKNGEWMNRAQIQTRLSPAVIYDICPECFDRYTKFLLAPSAPLQSLESGLFS